MSIEDKIKNELSFRLEIQQWDFFLEKTKWKKYRDGGERYEEMDGYYIRSFEYCYPYYDEFGDSPFFASLDEAKEWFECFLDAYQESLPSPKPSPWMCL